jgi:hypothetical protein
VSHASSQQGFVPERKSDIIFLLILHRFNFRQPVVAKRVGACLCACAFWEHPAVAVAAQESNLVEAA